jgi:hypothetical protein
VTTVTKFGREGAGAKAEDWAPANGLSRKPGRDSIREQGGAESIREPVYLKEGIMKTLRILGVMVATLAFAASGMAQKQDFKAFLGVWQINKEKTQNYQQQMQMIINLPSANGFTSTRAQIGKENSQNSTEVHPVTLDGVPQLTSGGDVRTIAYKLVDSHTIARTQDRNGKISMDTEQVSADGKTLTVTQNGVVRVYDKLADVKSIKAD